MRAEIQAEVQNPWGIVRKQFFNMCMKTNKLYTEFLANHPENV